MCIGNYKDGKRNGKYIDYYDNGQVNQKKIFFADNIYEEIEDNKGKELYYEKNNISLSI